MSAISNCPNCAQPVTVPDGLEPAVRVRCPTCEAEYPLSEALAAATQEEQPSSETTAFLKSLEAAEPGTADAAPPELVPVAAVMDDAPPATPDEVAAEESGVVLEQGPADQPTEALQPVEELDFVEEPQVLEEPLVVEEPEIVAVEVVDGPKEGVAMTEQPAEIAEPPQDWEAAFEAEPAEVVHEPAAVVGEPAAVEEGSDGLTLEPEVEAGELVLAPEAPTAVKEEAEEPEEVPAALDPDPLVRGPHGGAEFRLSELVVVSTGQPLGPVTASVIAGQGLLRPLSEAEAEAAAKESPALDVWGKIEAAPQLDLGYGTAAGAADHAGFAIKDEELEEQRAAGSLAARPRRKRKEKSLGREMVGIVLGGVAGVIIASYLVVMIKGNEANFLKIPLPGCPSTYGHCPTWWPQWAKIGAPREEPAPEEESETPETGLKEKEKASEPEAKKPSSEEVPGTGPEAKEKPKEKPAKPPAETKKPKPAPASSVGPLSPPSYTSDQLGEALAKANAEFGCKACNSTGKVTNTVTEIQEIGGEKKEVKKKETVECEVCHGQPLRVMKDSAYQEFCRMGEVITFVQEVEGQKQLDSRKRMVRALLEKAGESDDELAKIGDFAAAKLADEGRLEPGIFLAATVKKTGPVGAVHVSEVLLSKSGEAVTVTLLSPQSLPAAQNDRVLVLGSIVEEPSKSVAGYEGPQPLVVWVGECIKLP